MSMPYIAGPPIRDPANFYGRKKAITRFYESITGNQVHSLSLLGLRRAGKTSFLYYVSNSDILVQHLVNPDRYVMIYMDMSVCRTPAHFYRDLLTRLGKTLNYKVENDLTAPVSMDDVEALLSEFPDRRIVLLLDEFEHISESNAFDQDFLAQLRSMAGTLGYELAYVTASYYRLPDIGSSVGLPTTSPFYNIFLPPIYLAGLEPVEAERLIREPAKNGDIVFTDGEVAAIRQMGGSVPFFLQATANKWFLARWDGQSLNKEDILTQIVAEMSPHFLTWWKRLGDSERDLLGKIAGQETIDNIGYGNSEASESKNRLQNYGLLVEQEGELSINGAVFASWIRQQTGKNKKVDPVLPVPDTGELGYNVEDQPWYMSHFPKTNEIGKEQSESLSEEIEVVIITATKVELRAVTRLLKPYPGQKTILLAYYGPETYYIGKFGAHKTVVTKCRMGAIGEGAAILATERAQRLWRPKAVIMVGVAFGKDPKKQKMADVLVASQIISYEQQRVGEEIIHRGAIKPSNTTLLNRFENVHNWRFTCPDGAQCNLLVGPILSGEKLVDALDFKATLFKQFPQAIGGEMEGAGLCAASGRVGAAWILVKSICDWGDGKKHKKHQPLAAAAAASLAHHVLSQKTVLNAIKKLEINT